MAQISSSLLRRPSVAVPALSVINTLIGLFGADIAFVIGLGLTLLIDGTAYYLVQEGQAGAEVRYVAAGISLFVSVFFVFFGYAGARRWMPFYIIGLVLYGLDAALCIWAQAFMQAGFHGLALFYLIKAFPAKKAWDAAVAEIAAAEA